MTYMYTIMHVDFSVSFDRPYVCVLGQMPGTDIYRDVSVYKEVNQS